MANSTWQRYPLQGLRNDQSNHLLGKTHGSKQLTSTSGFFPKQNNCFFSVQKRQFAQEPRHLGVGTLQQKPIGWNSPWRWCFFGHSFFWGYWGNDIGLILADLYISWYYAIKLWGYAFLSTITEFPTELLNSLRISAWILMPLHTKTKC